MRILPAAATSLTALLLLNSCSGPGPYVLFNNTDLDVQVVLTGAGLSPDYVLMRFPPHAQLASDERRNGKGPEMTDTSPCTVTLRMSDVMALVSKEPQGSHPTYVGGAVPVQMESDFSVYILPRDVTLPAAPADIEAARGAGKFLRPVISSCGEAQPQAGQRPAG